VSRIVIVYVYELDHFQETIQVTEVPIIIDLTQYFATCVPLTPLIKQMVSYWPFGSRTTR
jgi:hypothetical protein